VNTDITEWVASEGFEERRASDPVTLLLHGYGSHEQDLPPILEWLGLSTPWVSPRAPIALPNGGFMVSQLLRTRPDRIAKAAMLAGFVAGTPQPADPDLVAAKPAVFWSHGTADTVIVPAAVERTAEFLHTHTTVIDKSYTGLGHSIDERLLDDLREYLASA